MSSEGMEKVFVVLSISLPDSQGCSGRLAQLKL